MAIAFEQYWKDKGEWDKSHKKVMCTIVPTDNPSFNRNALIQNINDIPNMTDAQLRNFIDNHFTSILNNVFSGNMINEHVNSFKDPRFLDAFADVLQLQKFYERDVVIKINNICYDYLSLNDPITKNPDVVNKMIRISNIINRINLPRLLGLGLNNTLASILLIARNSSFSIDICIRRVNFIIITQPKVLMSEEMIREIFYVLYQDNEEWVRIFQYFMLDVIPEYNENDLSSWVTEEIEEVNSTINLAILDILNNLQSRIIRGALINYAESYNMINNTKPIRFSMQRLSDDYNRVVDIVNYLYNQENIYVP